jgi:hypothetical protein
MSDNEQNDRNIESITKLLTDLKVTELKSELETRGLDTNGIKAVLADRLQEHLEEQGHDVEIFDFNPRESLESQEESSNDSSEDDENVQKETSMVFSEDGDDEFSISPEDFRSKFTFH